MFLLLLRKLWIRRRRSDTEKASTSSATSQKHEFEEEPHLPGTHHDETDQIVNHLAALAATVSNTSSNSASSPTAAPISEPQLAAPIRELEELEEESFYHLRSLITVSCLPQHIPGHTPTHSASTLGSNSGKRKSQIFDRKRASSILSLHLNDLPSLPFPSKGKVSCKPCPRYSPLPPPFVPKRLAIRPEVRF